MADENVLAEKEFDIPVDDKTQKVKATATFLIHDVAPQERGIYILNFALGIREKEQDELPSSPLVREKSRHL